MTYFIKAGADEADKPFKLVNLKQIKEIRSAYGDTKIIYKDGKDEFIPDVTLEEFSEKLDKENLIINK